MNLDVVLPIYNNWFRPYPLFLTLGFASSVLLIFFKAKSKNIPLWPLCNFIYFLLPVALFTASFFGKLDILHPIPFYRLFEFWKAGLSIHGAIIGGFIAALFYFSVQSEKYQISLWVWLDLIAPEILIGQAIGRWGNFFNHEILGQQVSLESLRWLPSWISNNCFKFDLNYPGQYIPLRINGQIAYFEPLFLYESMGTFLIWIIIKFLVPNIGKIISKKPWKNGNKDFSNIKYKARWDKVYYEYEADHIIAKKLSTEFIPLKIKKNNNKIKYWFSNKKHWFTFIIKRDCKELNRINNPYGIIVIRSGVLCGSYFLLYNILRLILEVRRDPSEMFIKNLPIVSYTIIFCFIIFGLFIIIISQFLAVNKWRKVGWYYEKQY